MQAVQRTASWQVRGTNVAVSERIRRLWELTDAVQKDTALRLEAEPAQPLTLASLAEAVSHRAGGTSSDRPFPVLAAPTRNMDIGREACRDRVEAWQYRLVVE